MHIAFVNHTQKWGGVKTWCLDMAQSCVQAGIAATIFGQDALFIEKAQEKGISARRIKAGIDFNPCTIYQYYQYFCKHNVTAVVVNVSKDLRTAGVAAKLAGIPIIQHIGAPRDFNDSLKKRIENALLTPKFLCCSEYVVKTLQQHVPHIKKYTCVAIHPGTQVPSHITPHVSAPLQLITTSRLSADKKHLDLLEAVRNLHHKKLSFALTIVGDGPERNKLEEYVERNNLSSVVTFTGFVPCVQNYLQLADIFILPSWHEPLGIALEEAMAQGIIPIARRSGGVPEIWPPCVNNLLIPQHENSAGFTAALEWLLQQPAETLQALKQQVHTHALQTFNQNKQFAEFIHWVKGE